MAIFMTITHILTYFVDDLGGNRVQVTDVSGNEYSIDHVYSGYATRKEDLFYYDDTDASFAPDVDDQVFDFEFKDASSMIDDVSVYTMEVRDPYGYGLDYTSDSYYIDNPDTSVGGKVRVTDEWHIYLTT